MCDQLWFSAALRSGSHARSPCTLLTPPRIVEGEACRSEPSSRMYWPGGTRRKGAVATEKVEGGPLCAVDFLAPRKSGTSGAPCTSTGPRSDRSTVCLCRMPGSGHLIPSRARAGGGELSGPRNSKVVAVLAPAKAVEWRSGIGRPSASTKAASVPSPAALAGCCIGRLWPPPKEMPLLRPLSRSSCASRR